jgi:enoyl-CoA hydratase
VAASTAGPLVRYERRGAVALLTIDHPPVNVLSADVLDALRAALSLAESDREARVVVLAGAAERAFAAGANIKEMAPMGRDEAFIHGGRGQGVTTAIEALPLPVIAAVHGSCLGGGCEIALACDFILASDDAKFGQPEINLGVMPGWGGTRRLPRRIGAARARAWILTGRAIPAMQAFEEGLVHEVVPRAELLPRALALGAELAQKPATALAAAKFALQRSIDPSIHEGLAYELQLWSELFATPDQKEGMAAFLGKRPAHFEARPEWAPLSRRFPRAPGAPRRSDEDEEGEKRKN